MNNSDNRKISIIALTGDSNSALSNAVEINLHYQKEFLLANTYAQNATRQRK